MYVTIAITATFATPFTIGSGATGDTLTNRPTVKDGQQNPIIPGSALKGRLRHTCEQIVRALLDNDHATCHPPQPDSTCPLDPHWLGSYCPICRLFGSPRRPSPLMFTDLRWTETAVSPPTLIRTGVSINRKRRVAEPGRLYDLEAVAVPSDTAYVGQISGHLTDPDAAGLVALLHGGLQAMTTLGGSRSSGLGRCTLQPTLQVDQRAVSPDWLRQALQTLTKGGQT